MTSQVTKFENDVDRAYEALETSKLNFDVVESPLMNMITGVQSPNTKQLIRSDTNEILGDVGIDYCPVQNTKAFSFFDTICDLHGARYKEAISVNNGAKIILKAEFPQPIEIKKDDVIKKQIILINGFDGKVSLHADFICERLVCTNGLRASVRDMDNSVRLKHTKNVELKMEDALRIWSKGLNYFDRFVEMSKSLAQKQVDKQMVDTFLIDVFGDSDSTRAENKKEQITNLFENGMGNNGETAWDLYNSVTEYIDHVHGKDENRHNYSLIGSGAKIKEHAFQAALNI